MNECKGRFSIRCEKGDEVSPNQIERARDSIEEKAEK